ncbi:glutamyl-tRNA(Gln) amidotransferase subunit A [Colletotrichum higginsianum]|uniref:Glutamyl-tRNA(Gln) amidotransferase subunit A n=2 Tax=Colletotrichum higginsianum TaxID=80884 RepID=H1VFN2_COLHI|nr:Glutamyl-tRNA(Gln) amidotransferase subunit A [Colletotrichum higginsianum IMI 349063]OBR05404.1 Glutamyl-tRNA(Gln) amidotransferase subunit A [Colletotrichum higginsianum IMI 349063]CCF39035.1 glutamyl-tRNA(Gln) amidotransferase subunit A [Colletotrichum higginsianum]
MPVCGGTFKLEEATIDQMQKAMQDGIMTSQQLVICYVQRTFQTQEYISSVMQMNPDVLAIAARMDELRKAGQLLGPLHGIPFTVKDNIATKDSMETTAGSWALLGSVVPRDAFVVARLRAAGAVLFGKATMSEWADMRSTGYSEGYSPRGGQARSPYNLTLNPFGSSSGSAIGVAANAIAFSLGTETDGSVISPAHRNAVVGFKPTVGLTSRDGVIPECEHQDTVGTFGRTVRDAVYALDAIYGVDPRDNYTDAQRGKTPLSGGYSQFLTTKTALKNATFGIPWHSFWDHASAENKAQLGRLIDLIKAAGARVVNYTEIADFDNIVRKRGWDWDWRAKELNRPYESEYTVVKVDFYNNIKKYLSELQNTDIRSLEDIIRFNYENDGTEGGHPYGQNYTDAGSGRTSYHGHPAFRTGQNGFLMSNATQGVQDETYWRALEFMQRTTRDGIDAALTHDGTRLSGLLVPPSVGQTYQIAAQAGYPMVTIPAGVDPVSGMPFGLGIMQTAFGEEELVRWASAIEDLQLTSGTELKRTRPKWYRYLEKPLPVRRES